MTPPGDEHAANAEASSQTARRAHRALLDWWDEAGVEVASEREQAERLVRLQPHAEARPGAGPGGGRDQGAGRPAASSRPGAGPASSADQGGRQGGFAARIRPDGGGARSSAGRPISPTAPPVAPPGPEARLNEGLAEARRRAAGSADLEALKAALAGFTAHPLHEGARTTVFARGAPGASVMIIGEAPGKDEDQSGVPFVGRAGRLLDAMFAEIGLAAERDLYITNVVNWRPPANRSPSLDEIALCLPFLARHIALADPKLIVLAGGVAAKAALNEDAGIMRLRGAWRELALPGAPARPCLPTLHPAYLLRQPASKREVWRDLLALRKRLDADAR